jgi:hypothetical protein
VARAPVAAEPGTTPSDAVRRILVRGPEGAGPPDESADDVNFGPAGRDVLRFVLPAGAGADPALEVFAPAGLRAAEAWDGSAWVPLTLEATDPDADPLAAVPPGGPVEVGAPEAEASTGQAGGGGLAVRIEVEAGAPAQPVPAPPLGDPFDPMARVEGRLPAGAVIGGEVLLRTSSVSDGMPVDVRLRAAS